ncbi:hypothetical protein CEXT_570801 [Caerostris extrusa]|uniref:Ycf15 n=1 Tax=Caerostris extrusa TaxID=172846 RepID=A0AAV4Y1U9_CAEEX|nr:hypothetical protein CEXT_570801 [Caerostris extrusa]
MPGGLLDNSLIFQKVSWLGIRTLPNWEIRKRHWTLSWFQFQPKTYRKTNPDPCLGTPDCSQQMPETRRAPLFGTREITEERA